MLGKRIQSQTLLKNGRELALGLMDVSWNCPAIWANFNDRYLIKNNLVVWGKLVSICACYKSYCLNGCFALPKLVCCLRTPLCGRLCPGWDHKRMLLRCHAMGTWLEYGVCHSGVLVYSLFGNLKYWGIIYVPSNSPILSGQFNDL